MYGLLPNAPAMLRRSVVIKYPIQKSSSAFDISDEGVPVPTPIDATCSRYVEDGRDVCMGVANLL